MTLPEEVCARRIDAHLHYWDVPECYPWLSNELPELNRPFAISEAEAAVRELGFDSSILVQADDSERENTHLAELVDHHRWLLGFVGWVPLDDPVRSERILNNLVDHTGLIGVRELIHEQPDHRYLLRPRVQKTLRMLASMNLPLDIPDAYPAHFAAVRETARSIPELTLVLDHLGKPPEVGHPNFADWSERFARMGDCENIVVKVSGLHRGGKLLSSESVQCAVNLAQSEFGSERIMLGSDWPMPLLGDGLAANAVQLQEVRSMFTDVSAQRDIAYYTAARVYGIGGERTA